MPLNGGGSIRRHSTPPRTYLIGRDSHEHLAPGIWPSHTERANKPTAVNTLSLWISLTKDLENFFFQVCLLKSIIMATRGQSYTPWPGDVYGPVDVYLRTQRRRGYVAPVVAVCAFCVCTVHGYLYNNACLNPTGYQHIRHGGKKCEMAND